MKVVLLDLALNILKKILLFWMLHVEMEEIHFFLSKKVKSLPYVIEAPPSVVLAEDNLSRL